MYIFGNIENKNIFVTISNPPNSTDLNELNYRVHHMYNIASFYFWQVLWNVEAEKWLAPGHPVDHAGQLHVQIVLGHVKSTDASHAGQGILHDAGSARTKAVSRDIQLNILDHLIAGQTEEEVFERLDGQLPLRHVEVLEVEGGGEKLFEGGRNLALGLSGGEGIPSKVEVGKVRGAASHQGTEQNLRRDVGGGEVQDGDNVRLGQKPDKMLDIFPQRIARQVQVCQRVET